MSDADPSRRQSRNKQPKSYRVQDEYSFLDEDSESARSETRSATRSPDFEEPLEDGDDFMPDVEEEAEDDFDEDVAESSASNESSEASDSDGGPVARRKVRRRISTPVLEIVEVNPVQASTPAEGRRKVGNEKATRTKVKVPIQITRGGGTAAKAVGATSLRARDVADFTKSGGQEVRLKDLFGPSPEDLKTIFETRDHWFSQETLPLRKPGGTRRSFFESEETREKEIRTTRTWYAESGREAFAKVQKSRSLSKEEAKPYLANSGPDSLNVLFGPVDTPQVYTLKQGTYVHAAEPFRDKKGRRGWLFNLGSRIQDAQWATNEESNTQYLAVAVEQKCMTGPRYKPMEEPIAPAFTATKPFPGSIQIWAFEADANGWLDNIKQPRLQLVICTDWGAPKQFRWSLISPSDGVKSTEDEENVHIGLLAGIWSDGRVRVLDVACPKSKIDTGDTHYLHISDAAFESRVQQTVPSCLRWLSGTTLAVGTALGTLAIWSLHRPDTLSTSNDSKVSPRPWFYQHVADSYILTISSGWPSQPHLISVTIADGFARIYDLRSPNADTTASIRGRTLCLTQDWHEHTQAFVGPDEHFMLKHTPIRRFYHNLYTMRAESTITRCAASPVQPGVLIGCADGRVAASNPVARITNYKLFTWQQTWFKHEWRRPVDQLIKPPAEDVEMSKGGPVGGKAAAQVPDATTGDTVPVPPAAKTTANHSAAANPIPESFLSQPLARITEGYQAFQPGIQHSVTSKKVHNPETGNGLTVFEEQSAVTALAWNPNLKFGTWAVAGMGDGLLRVEDIGV